VPEQKSLDQSPSKQRPYKFRKRKPARIRFGRAVGLGLAIIGVAMLSATAGALLAVSLASTPLMQSQLSPEDEAVFTKDQNIARVKVKLPELTRPVNILVLGTKVLTSEVDDPQVQEEGYHALVNSFKGLSDTMLLVRFEPTTRKLTVLSIPRDTRTWVEGVGITKINVANYYGGPALSAKSVSELMGGVGIDRYVRINVQGIEKLIDALGGVTVNVPRDMKYQDDSQHLYINLKAGEQHLDGAKALQFLRFRYDEYGDIGRVQRQQMLMRSLMEQTLNPATLARLPKILNIIQSHIDTNLSVEELVALVGFSSGIERSNVQMLMIPGRFSTPDEYEYSYWVPSSRRLQAMVAQHFDVGFENLEERDPIYMRVAIQDSTDNPSTVRDLVEALRESGYRNVYIAKPWPTPLLSTRIIAQQGDGDGAEAVRSALGFGEVRVESTGNLDSDITIQIGKDWTRHQAQVEPIIPDS